MQGLCGGRRGAYGVMYGFVKIVKYGRSLRELKRPPYRRKLHSETTQHEFAIHSTTVSSVHTTYSVTAQRKSILTKIRYRRLRRKALPSPTRSPSSLDHPPTIPPLHRHLRQIRSVKTPSVHHSNICPTLTPSQTAAPDVPTPTVPPAHPQPTHPPPHPPPARLLVANPSVANPPVAPPETTIKTPPKPPATRHAPAATEKKTTSLTPDTIGAPIARILPTRRKGSTPSHADRRDRVQSGRRASGRRRGSGSSMSMRCRRLRRRGRSILVSRLGILSRRGCRLEGGGEGLDVLYV